MEGSIDLPYNWQLLQVFLRSGFANRSHIRAGYRVLPCATGTFVNSSDTNAECKKCPAGKLHYSMTKFRERSMYMSMNMGLECGYRC